MAYLEPAVVAEVLRKLEHARDGARRIQNGNECEPDRASRIIAGNVGTSLVAVLKLLQEAGA